MLTRYLRARLCRGARELRQGKGVATGRGRWHGIEEGRAAEPHNRAGWGQAGLGAAAGGHRGATPAPARPRGRSGAVVPTCSRPRGSFLLCQAVIYGPFPASPPPPRPLQKKKKIIIQEQRRKLDLLPRAAAGPAMGAVFVLTSVSSGRRRLISGGIPPSSRCSTASPAQKGPRGVGAASGLRGAARALRAAPRGLAEGPGWWRHPAAQPLPSCSLRAGG